MIANEIETTTRIWYGCYDGGWKDITPEAFQHPAKFAQGLVRKIFEYGLEMGYIKVGDVIIDPFGGVGLGAKYALANGLSWVGCELEKRFTDLGQGCDCTGISKADWVRYYGRWDKVAHKGGRHWCPQCLAEAKQVVIDQGQLSFFEPEPSAAYTRNSGVIPETKPHHYTGNLELFRKYAQPGTWAVLLNGDSRNLRQVIGQAVADGLLSSPPYSNGCAHTGGADPNPQYIQGGKRGVYGVEAGYGSTTGQLGGMSEGSLADSLVSSPPYIGLHVADREAAEMAASGNARKIMDGAKDLGIRYGSANGQLGTMKSGNLADSLLSSPPFAGNTGGRGEASRNGIDAALFDRHSGGMKKGTGDNPANLDHLPMKGFGEALQGDNVGKFGGGLVYFFLLSPENSIAALVEVGVSPDVLSLLFFGGMPVFSIHLNNGIEFRQEEVSEVPPDLVLSDIRKSSLVKKFGKGILKPTLFGETVALNGAINPAALFEAMRLSKEMFLANRALLFNASFSREPKALDRTEFSLTSLDSSRLSKEFFTTLQASFLAPPGGGNYGTLKGAILCPLLGVTWSNTSDFSAYRASNSQSIPPGFTIAEMGAKFSSTSPNITDSGIKFLTAILADSFNCRHILPDTPDNLVIIPENEQKNQFSDALVSSPPFENNLNNAQFSEGFLKKRHEIRRAKGVKGGDAVMSMDVDYGTTPGQLGTEQGTTFWAAARLIVSESYLALKPGSYAFFVCKKFVRDGTIVDFPGQWRQLCEAVGFEYVETIRAMLVSRENGQGQMDGGVKVLRKEKKSFFRRLAEKNGSPRIDYEEIIVMRKPL